jgi:hypothetical protein
LSRWFQARVGAAKGRIRRIAIVAPAPKLLVALWRYVTHGVVPLGACSRRHDPMAQAHANTPTLNDLPIPAKLNATASPDPGGRRINPRAETRREEGSSRQPEPDALEHEGLWSEPTSSTGCEVMRPSGLHGKGSRFGSNPPGACRFAACFRDFRCPGLIEHEVETLIGQRVRAGGGYEDLVDHHEIRHDPVMAILAGSPGPSWSKPGDPRED